MGRILSILTVMTIVAAGCSRAPKNSSKIVINPPTSSMASSLAALPVGRAACYGVSVNVPGLTSPALTCSPELGFIGGFVSAGSSIALDVPKGSGISIKLYMYLKNVGDTNPCPKMGIPFAATDLNNIYLVGSANDLTFSKDEEVVNITSVFPGEAQTIAQELSMPASCTAAIAGNRVFRVNSASGQVTDGVNYKLNGRVGRVHDGNLLSNGSYKLIVNK